MADGEVVVQIMGDNSEFVESLKNVNKQMQNFEGQISSINKSMRFNPENVELLEQKLGALSSELSAAQSKLELLQSAEQQATEKLANGEIGKEQFEALRREILNTEAAVREYSSAIDGVKSHIDSINNVPIAPEISVGEKLQAEISTAVETSNAKLNELDSTLADINKSLKLDPGNTEILQQKYNSLSRSIVAVQKKLLDLKNAEKDMTAAFNSGEISREQYEAFRREIINSETALKQLTAEQRNMINASSGLENVTDNIRNIGTESDKAADKMTSGIGVAGVAAAQAIAAAFQAALKAIVDFGKGAVENAAAVRAENSQFEQTFGEFANEAADGIQKIADSSGILSTRLNMAASGIYSFARSSGGSVSESMSLMNTALQASADAAAYYDRSLDDTTESLRSFLKGNFENDAALGVSCTETTRNAAAMELFGKKFQNLTEIQKQQTLLKMVTDSQALSGAMGQAAREAEGWENVSGNLAESWRQFQAALGDSVLDDVVDVAKELSAELAGLTDTINEDGVLAAVEHLGDTMSRLVELVTGYAPEITQAAVGVVNAFITGLTNNAEGISDAAVSVVVTLVNGILQAAPQLASAAVDIVSKLCSSIGEQLPTLVPAAVEAVLTIAQGLIDNVDTLIDAAGQLIMGLQRGIVDSIPQILEAVPKLVISLGSALVDAALTLWIDLPMQMFENVADGIENYDWTDIADKWAENGADALEAAVEKSAVRFMNIAVKIKDLLDFTNPDNTDGHGSDGGNDMGGSGGGGRREAVVDDTADSASKVVNDMVGFITEADKKISDSCENISGSTKAAANEVSDAFKTAYAALQASYYSGDISEADYYAGLERLLNDYHTKGLTAYNSYYKELMTYQNQQAKASKTAQEKAEKEKLAEKKTAEKNRLTSYKKSQKEYLTAVKNSLNELVNTYKEKYSELEKRQKTYADKIKDGFDLFNKKETDDKIEYSIANVDDYMKKVEQFTSSVQKLRDRGADESLIDAIIRKGVEDGAVFASQLADMSDADFRKINTAYADVANIAAESSEKLYDDRLKALNDGFIADAAASFGTIPPEVQGMGVESAVAWLNGLDSSKDDVFKGVQDYFTELWTDLDNSMDAASVAVETVDAYSDALIEQIDKRRADVDAALSDVLVSDTAAAKVEAAVDAEISSASAAVTSGTAVNYSYTADTSKSSGKTDIEKLIESLNKPLYITLDGKLLGESVISYINGKSRQTGGSTIK